MKLESAKKLAEFLVELMSEYCERIMIAGSIRRGKHEVKDIEIVCIPKWSKDIPPELRTPAVVKKPEKTESDFCPIGLPSQWELFGTADEKPYIPPAFSAKPLNLLYLWGNRQNVVRWIKPGVGELITWRILPDGKYWRGVLESQEHEPIKLDLFLTCADNWGVISTIRTGPAKFSSAMMAVIRNRTPFRVRDGFLTNEETGERVPCPEEEDFFRNCGLKFVPIEKRDGQNPYQLFMFEK